MQRKIVVLLVMTIYAHHAWAADENIQLDAIEVKATTDSAGSYQVRSTTSSTRTDTPIKQIPQSVIIVPRALLDDQQNVTVGEALKNVSGVVTNDEFSTPFDEYTRVRGFRAEQLIDGFTQYYNPGDRESLVNVRSLEVLKGSNAVLFTGGSGSPVGGVVNINSKLPQDKAFGELGVKLGTNSFSQSFFDINQPISENMLFRITGEYTKAESKVDVIEQKRYNYNPSLTFTNNNDTTFTLQGKISRWRQQEYQGLPAVGTVKGNFKIKDDLFIGNKDIPDSTAEFEGIWATLDHKFNEQWSINMKARYAESQFDEKVQLLSTNTPTFAPSLWQLSNANLFQAQKEESLLANTTYKFDLGVTKHTLLLGADHTELKDKGYLNADTFLQLFGFIPSNIVDLTSPVFNTPYVDVDKSALTSYFDSKLKNTNYGAFVQLQSNIAENFHFLVGLRQAHVELDYQELTNSRRLKTIENELLPRVGAVVDLNDFISIFANYSEGLRSQPFVLFAPNTTPKPTKSESKEIGVKFDVNDQLAGQIALYDIDRTNTNVSVGLFTLPNGEERSRGYDVDLTWQPNSSWKFLANYAYTNAEYTKNASATVLDGNQLAGIPKNSARLWANYKFPQEMLQGLSAGLGVYWQNEAYLDNANQFKADSYHTFDAAVNYTTDRFNLGLTIKNLTNEDYYQYYNYFGGRIRPDNGTQAYLTASFKY